MEKRAEKARRKKLSKMQKDILRNEFCKDPNWSRTKIGKLGKLLGMKYSKVYKWNYDQRSKVLQNNDVMNPVYQKIKNYKDGCEAHAQISLFRVEKPNCDE